MAAVMFYEKPVLLNREAHKAKKIAPSASFATVGPKRTATGVSAEKRAAPVTLARPSSRSRGRPTVFMWAP